MTTKSTIALQMTDPRLKQLISEQLAAWKDVEIVDGAADLILTDRDIKIPVRLGDMLDRTRYLLSGRDRWTESEDAYDLGLFWLEADENKLVHKQSGESIRLTDKERLLLRKLCEAPALKLSREKLLNDVWGYKEGTETHTLETHLYRLRQKLEPYGAQELVRADGLGNYSLLGLEQ